MGRTVRRRPHRNHWAQQDVSPPHLQELSWLRSMELRLTAPCGRGPCGVTRLGQEWKSRRCGAWMDRIRRGRRRSLCSGLTGSLDASPACNNMAGQHGTGQASSTEAACSFPPPDAGTFTSRRRLHRRYLSRVLRAATRRLRHSPNAGLSSKRRYTHCDVAPSQLERSMCRRPSRLR
jgi:hypothetical protein